VSSRHPDGVSSKATSFAPVSFFFANIPNLSYHLNGFLTLDIGMTPPSQMFVQLCKMIQTFVGSARELVWQ
jgi:hypothetical protein